MTDSTTHDLANILVIDDHQENLIALSAILSAPGYNIVTARSGAEGLKKILKQDFAVVLLDVLMPEMDGFETARLIRQREATRSLPIIFLSATAADVGLIYHGYSVGAVDYLIKPIDAEIVKAKVAVFVELFRKTRQIQRQEEQLREAEALRSAEALRVSESLYEATFNDAAVGIAHAAPDGRWLRANPKFCEIVQYELAELLRLRFQDVTYQEDLPGAVEVMHRMLHGTLSVFRTETRFLRNGGRVIWVNLTVSMIRNQEGQPRQFLAVVEDITERRRTEVRQRFLMSTGESLLSSLDYRTTLSTVARLAVPSMADGCIIDVVLDGSEVPEEIAIVQGDPRRLDEMRELRRFLRTQFELTTSPAAAVQDPLLLARTDPGTGTGQGASAALALMESLHIEAAMIVPMIVRGRQTGAVSFISTDPTRQYVEADLSMVADLAHRMALAVDNAQLYRQTQDAVGARDEFLSVASHELRTPLTPLMLQMQRLLSEKGVDPLERIPRDRLRQILQRTFSQTQRLAKLVETLLDVSRIAADKLELNLEQFELNDLVQEIASRFSDEAARVGCALSVRIEERVEGRWDRIRLEQVFTNLIDNALKYGRGNPVEISVESLGGNAVIRVRDHGIGIDPSKISTIFDRFERAVPTRSYGGLGLGLYIARRIVQSHNGTICVESKPGEGAAFVVDLPRNAEERASAEPDLRIPLQPGYEVRSSPG